MDCPLNIETIYQAMSQQKHGAILSSTLIDCNASLKVLQQLILDL